LYSAQSRPYKAIDHQLGSLTGIFPCIIDPYNFREMFGKEVNTLQYIPVLPCLRDPLILMQNKMGKRRLLYNGKYYSRLHLPSAENYSQVSTSIGDLLTITMMLCEYYKKIFSQILSNLLKYVLYLSLQTLMAKWASTLASLL